MAFLLEDRKQLHSLQHTPKIFTILLNAFHKYILYSSEQYSVLKGVQDPYVYYIFKAEK